MFPSLSYIGGYFVMKFQVTCIRNMGKKEHVALLNDKTSSKFGLWKHKPKERFLFLCLVVLVITIELNIT